MATSQSSSDPLNFGVLLFPGFQALDVFGPLDALNVLSMSKRMNLSIIAKTLDPVSTKPVQPGSWASGASFGESVVPTHTFDKPPPSLDVLLVPGGLGTRAPAEELAAAVAYVAAAFPTLRYLLTVCTGSALAARAGVLDGRRATTNKRAWEWVTGQGPRTHWVARARWVEDGNVWTASGVSAGLDVALAWIARVYGEETAQGVANGIEYTRITEPSDDPFAALNKCADVPPKE